MVRLSHLAAILGLGLAAASGGEALLVGVECELVAARLRGPARLCRDREASRTQCVEMIGERAAAVLKVRVPRTADYTAWVRARAVGDEPAAVSARDEANRLNAAIGGREWQWVQLGPLRLGRGPHELQFVATGALRLDQLVLAGDPGYTPSSVVETSADATMSLREVYFSDDFMRTQREAGAWQPASGTWTVTELRKRERFDATRSANAFSYLGVGSKAQPAAAVTGYPFWRNYSIEAAVRSLGGEGFGLILLRQDGDNYYLLRVEPRRGQIELLRVLDGAADRLAAAAGQLRVDDWYLLRLDACNGELSASIDGHVVLEATDYTLLEGLPGLWSADPAGAYFDDVLVRSHDTLVERFIGPELDGWKAEGEWTAARGELTGPGTLLTTESHDDFDLETTLRLNGSEARLVFDWQSAANHAEVALVPGPPHVEIREVREGRSVVLASAPLAESNGRPRPIRLSQRQGRVSVSLDGVETLGAFFPNSRGGAVGLLAAGEARFGALRVSRAQRSAPLRVHNRVFAGEDTMEAWASAASDWQLTTSGGRTIAWHEIDHWGDCAVRYELGEPPVLPGKLGLVVRADGLQAETGCQLIAEPQPNAPPKLTLLDGSQAVASAPAPAGTKAIELRWLGDCAVAFADDKMLLWHRASPAPLGRRAAVWAEGGSPAFERTAIRSEHLIDDYFEAAPVEWRVASGTWEMQNRWTCSPQWSWMGGSSPDAAMLWHKNAFQGDIAVHFFAAFQMKARDSRIYRPADLNVSICTDGQNPASGYTFLYGGWNNTATSLLRRDKVVASTTKVALRPPTLLDTTPDMNHLHRKWWHVVIEKRGPRVACYVDDQLAAEYTDPQPLQRGSVCVWTHDNSIMVARVWIAYEALAGSDDPLVPCPAALPTAPPPPPAVASSHKVISHDFEAGLGKWAGIPGTSAVHLEPRDGGLALAVTNPRSGGPFEIKLPFEPFNVLHYPRLTFDYRFPRKVKANLHLKVNGRRHAVLLTNREAHPPGVPVIGDTHIEADDDWHTADLDLRAFLLRCTPAAPTHLVEEMSIGTLDKASYLNAGFGGNAAGATYRLDNVRLWSPGPPDVKFTWDPTAAASYVLDREPATIPDSQAAKQGGSFEQAGLADGAWFFHLRAKASDGTWSRVAHVPIVVDASPPVVASASPANATRSPAHRVVLDFDDASGTDASSLKVALLGQEYPVQIIPTDPTASYTPGPVTFEPVTGKLALDLSMLPVVLGDGQEAKLTVATAKDFLGNAMPPYTLAWNYDRGADKEPPRLLRLEGSHPYLCQDDFEAGLGEWAATAGYSLIERDDSTAASGRYSLRIVNAHSGGSFPVTVRSTPFDAGRYPIVSFDYKAPANLRADLLLTIRGTLYTIRFTDPNGTNCIGAIPDVQADNQWHHTEFNLHEMLTAAIPQAASYVVTALQFADTGFAGNADGVEYYVDNFCVAPAASTRAAPLEWKLAAADPSGIAGYQYSLTNLPGATRWTDAPGPSWQFRNLGAGIFHFMARARDGAGNWSAPIHRQVLVDDQPPTIHGVEPAPGSRAAGARISVRLTDSPSGINRDKTVLTVAGVPYRTTDPGVTYDSRTQTLTWEAPYLDKPVVLPNGQDVTVALQTEDNVGNVATHTWSWKMDFSLDKTPPPAPYVAAIPSTTLTRATFEEDIGSFQAYSGYAEIARVTSTAATGRYSLCLSPTREGKYFGAYAYRSSYDSTKYPLISFDYRVPAGLAINLYIHDGSSWRTIKLTSPSAYYPVIGAVPIVADDYWHHVEIDLSSFLPSGSVTTIRYVLFADFGSGTARPGVKMYVDNFTIATRETGQNLRFEWNAALDPTGIAGYAYALDQKPDTLPAQLNGTAPAATFQSVAPGNCFFHLRVRDGAGNWSAPTHFPVAVPTPSPPAQAKK